MTTATIRRSPVTRQFPREDLKPGVCLCEHCTGKCCRYFALPIETPTTKKDFDHLRWYMLHGRVSLFVDQGTWFLMVHNVCDKLMPDNRCGIYDDRPLICRSYDTDNCEYDDKTCYDQFFETPEQIAEYAQLILNWGKKPKKKENEGTAIKLPLL